MESPKKTQLLEQFSQYLETADLEIENGQTDLYSVFTELASLRNEVKTQSRQFKDALTDFKAGFDALEKSNQQLNKELDSYRVQIDTKQQETERALLLEFLEVHDRLVAGLKTLETYKPTSKLFKHTTKQDLDFIHSVREGQEMSLRRLEQLLTKHEVIAIEVLNLPLDPHCMTAIEIEHQSKLENGIVIEELRRGFKWHDEVLRLAEVKVNKKDSK